MKKIILTQDYEIFFGKESGTVSNCMIKPIKRLFEILHRYNCTATIFWDVLHYWSLKQNVNKYPELQLDIDSIEKQLQWLQKLGHDIQLHIHPHWLDAKYKGDMKWNFKYNRYSLHDLKTEKNEKDINTILGCVTTCVDILKKYNNSRIVYRAGGYHLEPFYKLAYALKSNSIFIDSSIVGFPKEVKKRATPFYQFSTTPSTVNPKGEFVEFPIATIKIPLYRKLWYKYLKKKYKNNRIFGDGLSVFGSVTDSALLKELFFVKRKSRFNRIKKFVSQRNEILTPENNFKQKFNYLVRKAPDYSVMTLHPKYLTFSQLKMIENLIRLKKIRFISITEYLKNRDNV